MPIPEPASLKLVEGFLTYCSARNLSPHTLRAYRADLTQFIAFSGEDTAIDRKLVRRFLVQLHNAGLKPQSVRRKLAALKSFVRWLEAEGYSEAGVIDCIAGRYRRDELPDVPSVGEVIHLIEGELPHFIFQKTGYRREERDRLIVELLASGVLPSDLADLDLEDCRGDSLLVRARKGHEERAVALTENAKRALGAWLPIRTALLEKFRLAVPATSALLLTTSLNRPAKRLNPESVWCVVKDAKAGLSTSTQDHSGESYSTYGQRERVNAERDRLILELLYGCGLRVSELVGINLEDFHGEDVLLVRGKGKKERQVIVGEYARAALKAWLQVRQNLLQKGRLNTPALLFSVGPRPSERLDVRSVRRILRAVAKARGLDPEKWRPHLLRHAYATHLCDNGAALQAVSTLLGHARLSTTQIYTRVSTGRLRRSYDAAHPHAAKG